MQKIFVVVSYVSYGGEYDSAWESISLAFTDRSSAEAYILYQKDLIQRNHQFQLLLADFCERYQVENPPPPRAISHDIPRWRSGISEKDITVEMRAELTRLIDLNRKLDEEASLAREIYDATLLAAQQQYAATAPLLGGCNPPNRIVHYARKEDVRWRINEIMLHSSFDPSNIVE